MGVQFCDSAAALDDPKLNPALESFSAARTLPGTYRGYRVFGAYWLLADYQIAGSNVQRSAFNLYFYLKVHTVRCHRSHRLHWWVVTLPHDPTTHLSKRETHRCEAYKGPARSRDSSNL